MTMTWSPNRARRVDLPRTLQVFILSEDRFMMDAMGVELLFQRSDRVFWGWRRRGFWLKQAFDLRDEILALRFQLRDLCAKPQV